MLDHLLTPDTFLTWVVVVDVQGEAAAPKKGAKGAKEDKEEKPKKGGKKNAK